MRFVLHYAPRAEGQMGSPESFFLPDDDDDGRRFVATELTRGPWSRDFEHGGPPSALMARAIERLPSEAPMQIARMTVELLRPIPIAPLVVAAEVVRAGRTATLCSATLSSGERVYARASALAIRAIRLELPPLATPPPPADPERLPTFQFPFFTEAVGYNSAMEIRIAAGTWASGSLTAWMRMRFPLVPGEAPSPLQRVMIAADSGNGVSLALDPKRWSFVNPDLTVHLHCMPEGEWIALEATTLAHENGIGLADTRLFDRRGPIGRGCQSLVVDAR